MPVGVVVADADAHAGLLAAILAERDAAQHAFLAERAVVVVHEQQAGRRIAGDVDVGPSVFVEIGGDDGHAVARRRGGDAGLFADVRERAVAVVAIQRMPAVRKAARAAEHRNPLPVAVAVRARHRRVLEREPDVVRDEQIEVAVAVVVEEAAAGAPARLRVPEPRRLRHVGEGPVAVVAIEPVLAEERAEEILEAVVVVVADADAGRPLHGLRARPSPSRR